MKHGKTLGLPLRCPKCPAKHYYGVLLAPLVPTSLVRVRRTDVCPNCNAPLEHR